MCFYLFTRKEKDMAQLLNFSWQHTLLFVVESTKLDFFYKIYIWERTTSF